MAGIADLWPVCGLLVVLWGREVVSLAMIGGKGLNVFVGNYLSFAYIRRDMQQVSVKQYADMIGKSRQWVLFLIINNRPLPLPVHKVEKVGKAYVITLNS